MLVIPDRIAVGHGAPLGIYFNHIEEVGPDSGLAVDSTLNHKLVNPKATPLRAPL